jgi:hypothetical protein
LFLSYFFCLRAAPSSSSSFFVVCIYIYISHNPIGLHGLLRG